MRKIVISGGIMLTLVLGAYAQRGRQLASVQQPVEQQPVAIIQTSMGDLQCVLYPAAAPIGTANFISLAQGTKDWTDSRTGQTMQNVPLYDKTIFHRVIPNFMIQGGDPIGSGMGGPGYKFQNESVPDITFDRPGRLAYANAGPGTNGSQFFITEVPTPFLDGKYTIFGQCDDASVELVKQIASAPRGRNDKPNAAIVIKHIVIEGASPVEAPPPPIAPPPPPSAAASAPPPTVSLGHTTEQVVAILGQPMRIAKVGTKDIYSYKDLKVTFLDGKVVDID